MTDIDTTTTAFDRLNRERPVYDFATPQELWSEIQPGLWQGGTDDADTVERPRGRNKTADITAKDFQFVTTLYAYARPVDWFVKEIRFGVYDSDMTDFDEEEMFEIVTMTHSAWKRGEKTLVRCQMGWNRSGLITALVLIRDGMSAEAAIELIRELRSPHALCNLTFVRWLLALDPARVRA